MNALLDPPVKLSKKDKMQSKMRAVRAKVSSYDSTTQRDQDFRCMYCGMVISGIPAISGVRNRNHCPYCLHSRHLDLYQAGDRLSACKAAMAPVGLALKMVQKKYPSTHSGELMLVHVCQGCGKISINRIAADDDAQSVLEVFEGMEKLSAYLKIQFEEHGIEVLQHDAAALVQIRLFGKH